MKSIIIAVAMVALGGCSSRPEVADGTTVLLFPEWEKSSSNFERYYSTNLFAVYSNKAWRVRGLTTNGVLHQFWQSDTEFKTIPDAKSAFGVNIDWQVKKAVNDSFCK